MQIMRDEPEAHALVKQHLERSIDGSEAVVLTRNNSDNRLTAATTVVDGSEIAERLADAEPESCLAVRLGRPYRQHPGDTQLLTCELCGASADEREVAHAGRTVAPMSAVMFDLDHFKQVNDRFGHGAGDDVLAGVGEALRAILRDSDFGGRYGGEEFLLLLPGTDQHGALEVAEKLRATIESLDFPQPDLTVTASFGIATYPLDALDADGLVRMADRALYAAKARGRNRVELLDPAPEREQEQTPGRLTPEQCANSAKSEIPSAYGVEIGNLVVMGRPSRDFSLAEQPEVFFTDTAISDAVRYAVRGGKARKLGPRLYTRNVEEAPESVARRNWAAIAAGYFPNAVIVGRTAFEFAPADDGSVFLAAPTARDVALPGLRLRSQRGAGPLEGDASWMGHDIHMSSRPRAFLENLRPSRSRGGAAARTLRRFELEEALEQYGRLDPDSLNRLRSDARRLAPQLGLEGELALLDALVATLLGTGSARMRSSRARARAAGTPFDPARVESFESLAGHLLGIGLPVLAENPSHDRSTLAFFEAYFSNYIEGTEFTVEEAERIVFEGDVPPQRPRDAHDILGTYRLVSDSRERRRVPSSADELLTILRSQHGAMLGERSEIAPGRWKQRPNQVGGREFVKPDLVEGTLREAFRVYRSLPPGFGRAAFAMFLVAEVHPFADGNGRMARLLLNSELSAAREQRIVVTTSDRGDYLAAMRGMTNVGNVDAYTAVLAELQRRTHDTDYSSLEVAERDLRARGAFSEPDESGGILVVPSPGSPPHA
jgi:diguanylate cyclase (GGDEF)-like protein